MEYIKNIDTTDVQILLRKRKKIKYSEGRICILLLLFLLIVTSKVRTFRQNARAASEVVAMSKVKRTYVHCEPYRKPYKRYCCTVRINSNKQFYVIIVVKQLTTIKILTI